jgi:hypothetical protein
LFNTYMHNLKNVLTVLSNYTPTPLPSLIRIMYLLHPQKA